MGRCPRQTSLAFTSFRAHGSCFSKGNQTQDAAWLGVLGCLLKISDEMEYTVCFVSMLKIGKEKDICCGYEKLSSTNTISLFKWINFYIMI